MPTYEDPSNKMEEAFENVRNLDPHRERLKDVTIAVFSAHASRDEKSDEPRGEALSCRGRPILGKIRISTVEDRAEKMADVRVLLNGDRWGQLSAAMQRSVIDNCLTQIEVQQKDGAPKLDDLGRPKLQQRPWDFELCGYNEVAERHGSHSVEVHNFRVLFDETGQTYLPHFAPDERPTNYLAIAPKRTKTRAKALTNAGSSDTAHQRGPLASKALIVHIERLSSPATLLAIGKLELQKKPRPPVVSAIKSRVLKMRMLPDYIRVEKGEDQQDPAIDLDLDAAVLVTSPSELDMDTLDRLVGGCRDVTVLEWILDDERRREDPRQEVVDVVEARLQDLGGSAGRTQPSKTAEAKRGPLELKMGKLAPKLLIERIQQSTNAQTLLGVCVLEYAHKPKPRAQVIKALAGAGAQHDDPRLGSDMEALEDGRTTTALRPDLAAAALLSAVEDTFTVQELKQVIPLCEDVLILNDFLDAEQELGFDARDGVMAALRQRIAELGPSEPGDGDSAAHMTH